MTQPVYRTATKTPAGKTPAGSLRLGRFSNIELVIHWSLLFIFGLIVVSLGTGVLPAWHPTWSTALTWTVAFLTAVLFFVSIALHEMAHALVGRTQGMPVDRITLFLFGGIAQTSAYPRSPKAELLTSLAGPATSVVIGLTATFVGSALVANVQRPIEDPLQALAAAGPLATLLLWLGPINILLAIFNMIPGFPLDGGRVLRATLWWITGDMKKATRYASIAGQGFAWLLIACGLLMIFGYRIPWFGAGPISGLWLVLIGWFLNNAARASYEQHLLRGALQDVSVSELMRPDVDMVPPTLPVDALVSEYIMRRDQRAFPVIENDALLGLVCIADVRALPRERWPEVQVAHIMTPTRDLAFVTPRDTAMEALQRLSDQGVNQLPVIEGSRLRGLVRREDILKWVALQ